MFPISNGSHTATRDVFWCMKSKSDIIHMMDYDGIYIYLNIAGMDIYFSAGFGDPLWGIPTMPIRHSPVMLLHTGQGESADDSSKLKNQKSRLDRWVSAPLLQPAKKCWVSKCLDISRSSMTRMESYSGFIAQGCRAISSVSGDVMCQYVSICVNMCHFVPVDAV